VPEVPDSSWAIVLTAFFIASAGSHRHETAPERPWYSFVLLESRGVSLARDLRRSVAGARWLSPVGRNDIERRSRGI